MQALISFQETHTRNYWPEVLGQNLGPARAHIMSHKLKTPSSNSCSWSKGTGTESKYGGRGSVMHLFSKQIVKLMLLAATPYDLGELAKYNL